MPDDEIPIKEKTEPFYLSKYFSFTQFHKILSECQILIQVARFGYTDIQEKIYLDDSQILQNKIDALDNLFYKLKDQLIKNCEPFMDEANQKLIDAEEDRIKIIDQMWDDQKPYKDIIDQRINISMKEILPNYFNACLNELIDIQTKLKIPLNNMGFLFPKGSEFDIKDWEDRFKKGE